MKFDIRSYNKMLTDNNIFVIYSGPIWANGLDGIAEMLLKRFEYDELSFSASQSVFSIFVEQMNNMMMYSAEKEKKTVGDGQSLDVSKGTFILGIQGTTYFIQSGNMVTEHSAKVLSERIEHLNSLDKKELRKYAKQQLHAEDDNHESKGAGIGLIEIARRATEPIDYAFEDVGNGYKYFTMYIRISGGKNLYGV
jgi:hypothetical protein